MNIKDKILWIDIETTGLDPNKDPILEIAAIITDGDLKVVDVFYDVAHVPNLDPNELTDWVRKTHTNSGLLTDVEESKKSIQEIDQDFAKFIETNFPSSRPIIAGSSIHFDRSFLKTQMKISEAKLHYRMIDVSSFREAVRIVFERKFHADGAPDHRALSDIQASIEEFKIYVAIMDRTINPKS